MELKENKVNDLSMFFELQKERIEDFRDLAEDDTEFVKYKNKAILEDLTRTSGFEFEEFGDKALLCLLDFFSFNSVKGAGMLTKYSDLNVSGVMFNTLINIFKRKSCLESLSDDQAKYIAQVVKSYGKNYSTLPGKLLKGLDDLSDKSKEVLLKKFNSEDLSFFKLLRLQGLTREDKYDKGIAEYFDLCAYRKLIKEHRDGDDLESASQDRTHEDYNEAFETLYWLRFLRFMKHTASRALYLGYINEKTRNSDNTKNSDTQFESSKEK